MCIAHSQMNNSKYARMDPIEVRHRMEEARKHLEICVQFYDIQWQVGRYVLHGHFDEVWFWQERCMKKFMSKRGVVRVIGDQCMHGFKPRDEQGEGLARMRAGFLTNSACIAKRLSKLCQNRRGIVIHTHVISENGRTRAAHVYPQSLCKQICRGIQEQIEADRKGQFLLVGVDMGNATSSREVMREANQIIVQYRAVEENSEPELQWAWDDVSGADLDPKAVRKRQGKKKWNMSEGWCVTSKCLYNNANVKLEKSPIAARWIDSNKWDVDQFNYRSRLAVREVNTFKRDVFFRGEPAARGTNGYIVVGKFSE